MSIAVATERLTRDFHPPRRLLRRARPKFTRALDGLTFHIETGECVALVGPNGAGKSTLLRVLATVVLPTDGTASIAGFDVVRAPEAVRRRIGVMNGDDRSFFWRLSGRENLRFFGELQGLTRSAARQRADELLELVGLANDADRRFAGYSTGMRQRLGIARALLHDPDVLLLDEPTANLDLEHRLHVSTLIRERLASGRVTALIASHDAGLAVSLANRVMRLDRGRLVEERDDRPRMRYVVRTRGLTDEQALALGAGDGEFAVDDLGDGHALSAAIASVVSGGGEVSAVHSLPVGNEVSVTGWRS